MPDSQGNFKGMSVPAAAWDRIFGNKERPEFQAYLDASLDAAAEVAATKAREGETTFHGFCADGQSCDGCRDCDMYAGEGDCGSGNCCGECGKPE